MILKRYPGVSYDVKYYGTIPYHTAECYGPYATRAAALGQITANVPEWDYKTSSYFTPDHDAFVEASDTSWTRV